VLAGSRNPSAGGPRRPRGAWASVLEPLWAHGPTFGAAVVADPDVGGAARPRQGRHEAGSARAAHGLIPCRRQGCWWRPGWQTEAAARAPNDDRSGKWHVSSISAQEIAATPTTVWLLLRLVDGRLTCTSIQLEPTRRTNNRPRPPQSQPTSHGLHPHGSPRRAAGLTTTAPPHSPDSG